MADRYLFKAKRLDWREFPEKEQWIIGYYVLGFDVYEQPVHLIFEPTSMFFSHGETDGWTEIDPSTVCQCTGLKDKNGKLIWENDIAWDSDERAFYEIVWNQEDMCWNVEDADGHKSEFEECYVSTLEVNGNRFDNPELLESEE